MPNITTLTHTPTVVSTILDVQSTNPFPLTKLSHYLARPWLGSRLEVKINVVETQTGGRRFAVGCRYMYVTSVVELRRMRKIRLLVGEQSDTYTGIYVYI